VTGSAKLEGSKSFLIFQIEENVHSKTGSVFLGLQNKTRITPLLT
jgi:hypothetical protein